MLTDPVKQEIRDRLANVAATMPGFRPRAGQRKMIAEVANAFGRCLVGADLGKGLQRTGSSIVCINGGTGIGKSLGYSLSGAVLAKHFGKKLVIASSTVALQEQLITKDLPVFLGATGLNLNIELAKGRTRFVCEYKLRRAAVQRQQSKLFDAAATEVDLQPNGESNQGHRLVYQSLLKELNEGSWNGDRDTLADGIDDAAWAAVTTDRHGCLSRRCPNYKSCAQVAARKRIKAADVIVANHDLVLSDLRNLDNMILPQPEECFYVFDEAHNLPGKAISTFASSSQLEVAQRLLDRLHAFIPALGSASRDVSDDDMMSLAKSIGLMLDALGEAKRYFTSLQQLVVQADRPLPRLEFDLCLLPDVLLDVGANLVNSGLALSKQLEELSDIISDAAGDTAADGIDVVLTNLGAFEGKIQGLTSAWALFIEEPPPDMPPIAKWVQVVSDAGGKGIDYQLCASAVDSSDHLKSTLWERAAGAVLCSANLMTQGSFGDFLRRVGLREMSDTTCVDVASPFDYSKQGLLVIPPMKASPKEAIAHTGEVTEYIRDAIEQLDGEGMLALFTSRRQMEAVFEMLPKCLQSRVLVQGSASKSKIIAEHGARVDRGAPSVIFGLDSFSEGVDLVGRYCTVLVIAKLPFQTPDDPVHKALAKWVERKGGDPFMEIVVPDASRKLEQKVGRLIRTESDVGAVHILDKRLWTTRYGRSMLQGLPPFRILAMGKEVFV